MPASVCQVVVLHRETPTKNDHNARKLAEFLGAEVTPISIVSWLRDTTHHHPQCSALIAEAETLVQLCAALEDGVSGLLHSISSAAHLFVYGVQATDRHASLLRKLSSDRLLGIEELEADGTAFSIPVDQRDCCGPFAGISVSSADPIKDSCFIEGAGPVEASVLVRIGAGPFFVRVCQGKSTLFFAACREVADVEERVSNDASLVSWFSTIFPLMAFLKSALGKQIWHSDSAKACFIIDDPLLKGKYGFLEYRKLVEATRDQRFAASIAFIPWNYRRSRRRTVEMFSAASSNLSLCVHGCDHTGAEFAATSVDLLRSKAHLALARMRAHCELNRLPFDEIMVFPQGLFSLAALQALGACGYLAAVNTSLCPSEVSDCLTLGDLLSVAITKYGGPPLFGRHYPKDVAEFAFDLYCGKPALIVEHHGFFRKGYSDLTNFVRQVNGLDAKLEWRSLATICSSACMKRELSDGTIQARFYTNRIRLVNREDQTRIYAVSVPWTLEKALPDAALTGSQWTRGETGERLATTIALSPGQNVDISIPPSSSGGSTPSWKPTHTHKARVLVRRVLSEFRDDHVDTNPLLSAMLAGARRLRARGKGDGGTISEVRR